MVAASDLGVLLAGGVFISYRRDDAAHVTGRIADALSQRFGRENIFVDVDSVAPGEDFVRKIKAAIEASGTFLAVIGANWLEARTAKGERRIDLPGDFIRLEVKSALDAGVRIIPVLVDGATMPRITDLPPDIAELVQRNAVMLNHATFARDMNALARQLEPPRFAHRIATPRALAAAAGLVAVIALGAALWPKGEGGGSHGLATTLSVHQEALRAPAEPTWITQMDFRAERNADGRLSIVTDLPYRERLMRDRKIDGLAFLTGPLAGETPTLLVQATNRSSQPVTVNEIQFEVIAATPDLTPLPVIRESAVDYHTMIVTNEGWGPMTSPRLTITAWGLPEDDRNLSTKLWRGNVRSPEPCADPSRLVKPAPVSVAGFVEPNGRVVFDLAGRMPKGFGGAPFICAVGELAYSDASGAVTLAFRSRVSNLLPNTVVASPAFEEFDLFLDADREGYVAVAPALAEIAPDETVTLGVRVHTDRSSRFDLRYSVRTASGDLIPGEGFDLELLTPRNQVLKFIQQPLPVTATRSQSE